MALYPIFSDDTGVVSDAAHDADARHAHAIAQNLAAILAATAMPWCAVAPAWAAPTVEPLKPCYVSAAREIREPVTLTGRGFTPEATVDVLVDDRPAGSVSTGPAGELTTAVQAPHRRRGERAFTITVAERAAPENTVQLRSRVTALSVRMRPGRAQPGRYVRWRGRGFTAPGAAYAHYVSDGRQPTTVRLARPAGACGTFDVRRRQFPFKPQLGAWTVQVDQQSTFSASPESAFARVPFMVSRVRGAR